MATPAPRRAPRAVSAGAAAALGLAAALAAGPRAARAQGEVYGAEDLTTVPRLVSPASAARLVAGSLPEHARRSGVGGTVQLVFVIAPSGRVEPNSVQVVSAPTPGLGAAARRVAERMTFVPGLRGDTAVRARVQLPIVYRP
jgi:protein TonB